MRLTYYLKESKGIKALMGILIILNVYVFGYLAGESQNSQKITVFQPKIRNISDAVNAEFTSVENDEKVTKNLVASKSGTRVYLVWCSGVSRIKPENKVYFDTLDEALKKGYKPASNCPGIENMAQ